MESWIITAAYCGFLLSLVGYRFKEDILSIFYPNMYHREFFMTIGGDLLQWWYKATGDEKIVINNKDYMLVNGFEFRNRRVASWFHCEGDSMPKNLKALRSDDPKNDSRVVTALGRIDLTKWLKPDNPFENINWVLILGLLLIAVVVFFAWKYWVIPSGMLASANNATVAVSHRVTV